MDRDRVQSKREKHGWYCRGYLPHCDWPTIQFITFRQFDSFPSDLLKKWQEELRSLPETKRRAEEYRRIESFIDKGTGSCLLLRPEVAQIVEDKLLGMHGLVFDLKGWVIMPNHVHMIAGFGDTPSMAKVIADLKGATAHSINKLLERSGSFWCRDYYDRFIRDNDHFENTLAYVHRNPDKAGLCRHYLDYPFSSGHRLFERQQELDYTVRRLNPALPVRESTPGGEF